MVRATPKHLFPVGTCGSADWAFIQAADIITGLCVNTITGPQQVVAVNTEEV